MIDSLKTLIDQKDTVAISEFISQNPTVLDEVDNNGSTGLMLIAYSGIGDLLEQASNLKKSFNFHEAIMCGKKSQVMNFLSGNKNLVNMYSSDGFTPLSIAAFFNQTEIAYILLDNNADPNLQASNPSKVNALHSAVARNNYDLCKSLIENGADTNIAQMQGVTPLHSAAHRGNLEIVKLLVTNGASIDSKMDNGNTAIDIAKSDGHEQVVNYLIQSKK